MRRFYRSRRRKKCALRCDSMRCQPELTVISVSFSHSSGQLDVRVECMITAVVYGLYNQNVASDMSLDETSLKNASKKHLHCILPTKARDFGISPSATIRQWTP